MRYRAPVSRKRLQVFAPGRVPHPTLIVVRLVGIEAEIALAIASKVDEERTASAIAHARRACARQKSRRDAGAPVHEARAASAQSRTQQGIARRTNLASSKRNTTSFMLAHELVFDSLILRKPSRESRSTPRRKRLFWHSTRTPLNEPHRKQTSRGPCIQIPGRHRHVSENAPSAAAADISAPAKAEALQGRSRPKPLRTRAQ